MQQPTVPHGNRCFWCNGLDFYDAYHDTEWGMPVNDDFRLFEKICLEGFQSGLSWLTILRKRENFRTAFCQFDFFKIAQFTDKNITLLLNDTGIVRHKGKIEATVQNAKSAIVLQREFGSLARYFWQYEVNVSHRPKNQSEAYVRSITPAPEAIALSKDLKKRGWKFVGPTTIYAFMQSMGLVNDHQSNCHAFKSVQQARKNFVIATQ